MLWLSLVCALATLRRRWRHGPRRPTWSFRFEVLVTVMRRNWRTLKNWPMERVRKYFDGLPQPRGPGRKPRRQTLALPGPTDAGIPGTWFHPDRQASAEGWRDGPVLLYLHGGSFLYGSTRTHADVMGRLALACDAPTLGIDYRLAPEHPPPAALEDVVAAYDWLLEQGVASKRIALAGDSAGGNLALQLLMHLRERQRPMPAAALLISPWVDLAGERASVQRNADYDIGYAEVLQAQARMYAGERPLADPALSPIHGDLAGLPALLVQVGGAELLEDECRDLVDQVRAAGGQAQLDVLIDMPHAAQLFAAYAPEGARAIERAGDFLRTSWSVEAPGQSDDAQARDTEVLE